MLQALIIVTMFVKSGNLDGLYIDYQNIIFFATLRICVTRSNLTLMRYKHQFLFNMVDLSHVKCLFLWKILWIRYKKILLRTA